MINNRLIEICDCSFAGNLKTMNDYNGFKDLFVYKEAYRLAMEVFVISKLFPRDEEKSLKDQIRRSSRSVCSNIGEGYGKRRYPKHFISKLSDADMEKGETLIWLDFSRDCGYITSEKHEKLYADYERVGRMLGKMMSDPKKFLPFELKN